MTPSRWAGSAAITEEGFKKFALNKNVKAIRDTTCAEDERRTFGAAKVHKIEGSGGIDCTCVISTTPPMPRCSGMSYLDTAGSLPRIRN